MIRVLSGAVLIAVAVAVVWFATRPVFEAVAFALLFMATGELIALCRAGRIPVPRWPATIASLLTLGTFSGVVSVVAPQLTTVRQPLAEMGRMAVSLLERLIEGQRIEALHVELRTQLVVRQTPLNERANRQR